MISEQLKQNEAKQKLEVKSCGQMFGLLKNLEHLFQEKTRGTAARVLNIKLSAMFWFICLIWHSEQVGRDCHLVKQLCFRQLRMAEPSQE